MKRIENEHKIWYAVQTDYDDTDWVTGSYDLEEAKKMCKEMHGECIAVIEESDDPDCIDVIWMKGE